MNFRNEDKTLNNGGKNNIFTEKPNKKEIAYLTKKKQETKKEIVKMV